MGNGTREALMGKGGSGDQTVDGLLARLLGLLRKVGW